MSGGHFGDYDYYKVHQFAYDNYTDKQQTNMCLMDWEAREWGV